MGLRHGARLVRGELQFGELREQRVHAIPTAVLEPHHELVGALELGQQRRRIRAVEHAVAELRGEPAEDGRAKHERADVRVERADDLGQEIVGDEALISAELTDGGERIGHATKPERREHERGGPSLRACVQQLDLVVAEADLAAFDEQLTRLGDRERELVRAQLGERAAGTQPRQAERRVDARDHDQACVRGEMLDGVVDRRQGITVRDGLQVVEHDHELAPEASDPVQQLVDRAARRPPPHRAAPGSSGRGPGESGRPRSRCRSTAGLDRCHGRRASPRQGVRSGSRTMRARQSTSRSRAVPPRASAPCPRRRPGLCRIRGRSTSPERCRGAASFASASGHSRRPQPSSRLPCRAGIDGASGRWATLP